MATLTTLVSFDSTNGDDPRAGLIEDGAGDLFGTTYLGGPNGAGEAFEIAKNPSGYATTPTILGGFGGETGGLEPLGGLVADAAGDLFGTTSGGGPNADGTVFEIAKTASG